MASSSSSAAPPPPPPPPPPLDPALVLIHPIGLGQSSWYWEEFINYYDGPEELLAPDLPGTGLENGGTPYDPCSDLRASDPCCLGTDSFEAATQTVLDRYTGALEGLIGHAIEPGRPVVLVAQGGTAPLAIDLAHRLPAVIAGLVLVSPPPWSELAGPPLPALERRKRLAGLSRAVAKYQTMERTPGAWALYCSRKLFGSRSPDGLWMEQSTRPERRGEAYHSVLEMAAAGTLLRSRSRERELRSLVQPLLVVVGEDPASSPRRTRGQRKAGEFLDGVPACEVAVVKGKDVLPHENPVGVRDAVRSLLRRTAAAGTDEEGGARFGMGSTSMSSTSMSSSSMSSFSSSFSSSSSPLGTILGWTQDPSATHGGWDDDREPPVPLSPEWEAWAGGKGWQAEDDGGGGGGRGGGGISPPSPDGSGFAAFDHVEFGAFDDVGGPTGTGPGGTPSPLPRPESYRHRGWTLTYRHRPALPSGTDLPPLLLVHGIGVGQSSWYWENLFGRYPGEIYAPDLMGCGLENGGTTWIMGSAGNDLIVPQDWVEAIEALMRERMGIGSGSGSGSGTGPKAGAEAGADADAGEPISRRGMPCVVATQSGLAPVGIKLASRNGPEAVSHLVMLSPPDWGRMTTPVAFEDRKKSTKIWGSNLTFDLTENPVGFRVYAGRQFKGGKPEERFVRWSTRGEATTMGARAPIVAYESGDLNGDFTLETELRRMEQPALILVGTDDPIRGKNLPGRGLAPYSANMKAETTVTIEGKFHLLWESPDEVVSALKSFLGIGNVRASPPPADKSADAEVQEILADAAASMARSSDPMISAVPILPNKRL